MELIKSWWNSKSDARTILTSVVATAVAIGAYLTVRYVYNQLSRKYYNYPPGLYLNSPRIVRSFMDYCGVTSEDAYGYGSIIDSESESEIESEIESEWDFERNSDKEELDMLDGEDCKDSNLNSDRIRIEERRLKEARKEERNKEIVYEYRNLTKEEATQENEYKLQTNLFNVNKKKDLKLPKRMKEKVLEDDNGNLMVPMTDKPIVNVKLDIDWKSWDESARDSFLNGTLYLCCILIWFFGF